MADDDRRGRVSGWLELGKVVAMPLVTLIVGYLLNSSLNYSQTRDSNLRLYADMMGRREEADSALRKDMFQSILTSFVQPVQGQRPNPESLVLNLELLAYNFHESLDLGPLFRHVQRQLVGQGANGDAPSNAKDLQFRLERVAEEVKERQLAAISDSGSVERGELDVNMGGAEAWFLGKSTIPLKAGQQRGAATICLSLNAVDPMFDTARERSRQFRVEYLNYSAERREVELSVAVSKPLPRAECQQIQDPAVERENTETAVQFWVGPFGFPMIDNTRLTGSARCSVTVIRIVDNTVTLAIAYFPASRASLKDKPYYDEVLNDLLRQPSSSGLPK